MTTNRSQSALKAAATRRRNNGTQIKPDGWKAPEGWTLRYSDGPAEWWVFDEPRTCVGNAMLTADVAGGPLRWSFHVSAVPQYVARPGDEQKCKDACKAFQDSLS